jgi:hypothetical protein
VSAAYLIGMQLFPVEATEMCNAGYSKRGGKVVYCYFHANYLSMSRVVTILTLHSL